MEVSTIDPGDGLFVLLDHIFHGLVDHAAFRQFEADICLFPIDHHKVERHGELFRPLFRQGILFMLFRQSDQVISAVAGDHGGDIAHIFEGSHRIFHGFLPHEGAGEEIFQFLDFELFLCCRGIK